MPLAKLSGMTAIQVIKQIKALPTRERRKVFRFVFEIETPNATTRQALKEDVSKARRFSSAEELLADLKR